MKTTLCSTLLLFVGASGFVGPNPTLRGAFSLHAAAEETTSDDESQRLREQAEKLREQVREMEAQLGPTRKRSYEAPPTQTEPDPEDLEMTLRGKRVLVAGANGRLGSMVCRCT